MHLHGRFLHTTLYFGNDYNTHIRVQKSIVRLNSQLAARLNKEAHVQTTPSQPSGGATSSSLSGGGMSSSRGQSEKRPGPFSKANSVKFTEEVPSNTSLIFDTGAEVSFIPDCYPLPTSPMKATVEVLLPDGRSLPVSGKLGQDHFPQST